MRKPGELLAARYRLQDGRQGGSGTVYRAWDETAAREVAVKELFGGARRAREAEVLLSLSHPQIPRVHEYFAQDDLMFLVMDYIEGESLEQLVADYQLLSGAPVPPPLAIEYAIQVCGILRYLHECEGTPIIHRDVKPGNLILRKARTEVVLVDFGLACGESMGGTMGYAPVEQLQGESEPRSDLYALGATLYFLVSGQPPPPLQACSLPPLYARVQPRLAELIGKATEQQAAHRFASAAEMEGALRGLLP